MKKTNKLILNLMLAIVCTLCFNINIKAEDTNESLIDLDTIKLEVEGINASNQQSAYIRIYDSGFDDSVSYVATITKDAASVKEQLEITDTSVSLANFKLEDDTIVMNAGIASVTYLPYAEKYGDVYVTFYVPDSGVNAGKYKKISTPILVKKPENLKISKRFKLYPNEDSTSIYYNNLGSISTERKVYYKLGKVTDDVILSKIEKGDYSGFTNLLSYAVSDKTSLRSGQIKVNSIPSKQPELYEQTDLKEGEYYYIYLELDDENDSYYKLDDVNLYQCLNNNGTLWLTDVYDQKFKWQEKDTLWDKFVEEFKKTDEVKSIEENENNELNITYTSDSLKVVLNDGADTWTTNFKYANGILTYLPPEDKELAYEDNIWISNSLYALINLKGYNAMEVMEWMQPKNSYSLDKDGLEVEMEEYSYSYESDGASITLSTNIYKTFKLDIENGFKMTDDSIIENPNTDENYDIVEGKNQKYIVDTTKELKFKINAEFSLFDNVYVDGKEVNKDNYTVEEGSTIIILKKEYLDTLNNGIHTLKVTFKDGKSVQTQFTIERPIKNPNTGINMQYGILSILILVGLSTYLLIRKKTKFPKHN